MPVAERYGFTVVLLLCACGVAERADQVPARADSSAADTLVAEQPKLQPLSGDSTRKLMPLDESAQDTGFARFRSQLLQAIQRRDTTFLYSILAAEIKNSFGGDDSIAGFRRSWRPDSAGSQVWSVLERVLRLGAVRHGEGFSAPYVFAKWPNELDAFENAAIVSDRAVVRAQPADTAQALGTLTYDIVPVKEWTGFEDNGATGPQTWARIILPDGRSGSVKGTDVYSPVGYRAYFEKRSGQWKIVYFLAGD
jgi:hypothetical protein